MKVYKGASASPGLVLGQVSRLERHVETFSDGPFNPEREQRMLDEAIHTAQTELDSMAERSAPTEQAIFLFQSMMLEDEGMMNEVRFQIKAGVGAAEAMDRVGRRYAERLANMKDNAYMQLRSVDILDATSRVVNILGNRPRVWMALDHPVILAADVLMPTDLFSVPSGMILGLITSEGSGQSHAAIIARAMNIPGIVQVGQGFLDDCDGRAVILDATKGECILDPDAAARQQAVTRICELQRENEELSALRALPNRTRDGAAFELLANCFGPEDIDTAMQSGACGVGLLRSSYMMLPGRILDEQEQYFFYTSCLAAANGCLVTVRTFDFGADRTMADAYQGLQSSKLGLRGIRFCLRHQKIFRSQLRALMRAGVEGNVSLLLPMISGLAEVQSVRRIMQELQQELQAAGLPHAADLPLGIMVETPAAVLIADALARECDFFSIGTNDLIHYLMAIDRNNLHVGYLNEALHPAVVRSLKRIIDSAHREGIGVSVCGELAADPYGLALLLGMGVDTLSASPRFVPGMKHMIRRLDAQTCMDMAHSVLMSTDVTASQRMLRERLQESLGSELAFHTTSIMTNS